MLRGAPLARSLSLIAITVLLAVTTVPAEESPGRLTFEERLAGRLAVEEVRWQNRIWPASNPGPKPAFAEVIAAADLRLRIEDEIGKARALELLWNAPLTPASLQAEIDRMAAESKDAATLRALFAALEDDAGLIAEYLAGPLVVDRRIRELYAFDDRFHSDLRERAEKELTRLAGIQGLAGIGDAYGEIEFSVLLEGEPAPLPVAGESNVASLTVNPREWSILLGELSQQFGVKGEPGASIDDSLAQLPAGKLSNLTEREHDFTAQAILEKSDGTLRLATVIWSKQPFDTWWSERRDAFLDGISSGQPASVVGDSDGFSVSLTTPYTLPAAIQQTCSDDTWEPTPVTANTPSPRARHTAVWTGNEMIVWGGRYSVNLNTGGSYEPATSAWTPTLADGSQPVGRWDHTGIWTGLEMIVWGGSNSRGGGRYNPATNSWVLTSQGANVPKGRTNHSAVWTGTEMIIWGGDNAADGALNSGGRYSPSTNSWLPTSEGTGVPLGRSLQVAVWTGPVDQRMVVWGGYNSGELSSGGVYTPATDSWAPTSGAGDSPTARREHTAVWTGEKMIVWGGAGEYLWGDGSSYDPVADSWTAVPMANAPEARFWHTAVWTDFEMIVWGGFGDGEVGGRFHPLTSTWRLTTDSDPDAPPETRHLTAVWTGDPGHEMIVWGGYSTAYINTGAIYCAGCPDTPWYLDSDTDTFGDPGVIQMACDQPAGHILLAGDCDDADAVVYPAAPQVCDGKNNDCDHPSWPGLSGTNEFDNDTDGLSTCQGDCDDADPGNWLVPGDTWGMVFGGDTETLSWEPPVLPGGLALLYDTLRSDLADDFVSAGFCLESDDGPGTDATDTDVPATPGFFYYLTRAGNGCGKGSLGTDSSDETRLGTACP
jgi:hypothetical protein